jgi:hypothetical protein
MDWRHNQWFGLGAAVLLVGAIVLLFMWTTTTPPTHPGAKGLTFRCESTNENFIIPRADLDNSDVYLKYFGAKGPVDCKICGKVDAYHSFFCPECNLWYKWDVVPQGIDSLNPRDPKGHDVDANEYP